jgi:hypothetical protein
VIAQPVVLACLSTVILLGCRESQSPTDTLGAGLPVHNYANAPSSPGPVVFRLHEPDWFIFLFPDFGADLIASVGLAERFSVFCEPALPSIPPQDLQFLFSPSGRLSLLLQGRDMPVLIYAGAMVGTPEEFCAHLATAPIIARGTARIVFNHHDLNTEASNGYRAHGTVELTGGGKAQFSGVVKFVTTPDGNTRVLVSEVNLSAMGGGR